MNRKYSKIFVLVCISLWFLGGLIILGGFIKESVENSGYTVQVCSVSNTMISKNTDLFGAYVNFQYISGTIDITKWLIVKIFETNEAAEIYLNENYPKGKYFPCYIAPINSTDVSIKLKLYDQMYTVTIGMILFLISVLGILIYVLYEVIKKYRRKEMVEFSEVSSLRK